MSSSANLRKRTAAPYEEPEASDGELFSGSEYGGTTAVETDDAFPRQVPDDYVQRKLRTERPLPPITWRNLHKNIEWVSTIMLTGVPIITLWGLATTSIRWPTVAWAIAYYFFTGLGITAGYHRFWAHRSYNASLPLQYFLALGGSGAVEGSIKWWSRGHRAHHRYTDTDLDPYSAHKGLVHSHVMWMILKPRRKPGYADVSDLKRNPVVQWQHRWYIPLILGMGFIFPTVVAGLGWGDWRGGFFYAAAARLLFVHHSTFCVNSLAHWLGEAPFDDKHTPRDHVITALVTIGEGYHNFHHEFPQDYRNAIKIQQYDPTKWFIKACSLVGLASELKKFPDNEIRKGMYNQKLKALNRERGTIQWPKDANHLPILNWEEFQEQCTDRQLVVIGGFIHDVGAFLEREEHPGGNAILRTRLGKDATNAFHGGVYNHSNAAHNLLAMMRVGVIQGGYEVESLKKKPNLPIDIKVYDGPAAATKSSPAVTTLATKSANNMMEVAGAPVVAA